VGDQLVPSRALCSQHHKRGFWKWTRNFLDSMSTCRKCPRKCPKLPIYVQIAHENGHFRHIFIKLATLEVPHNHCARIRSPTAPLTPACCWIHSRYHAATKNVMVDGRGKNLHHGVCSCARVYEGVSQPRQIHRKTRRARGKMKFRHRTTRPTQINMIYGNMSAEVVWVMIKRLFDRVV
jgi:hypothetical protein